ncbi:LuxR C-terminal-related transcriptional regulator [Sunxiuqinia sp. A32]|uniref:LuxR C-terminal-related transcriptional regulator n=1 Tax=Sunxiuqinia sp. A32 TaxID=3461496 RepID=UPI00404626DD
MLTNKTIKILIAFDEKLVAEGLKAILTNQNNLDVIALLKNDERIFNIIPQLNPDIIIFEFAFWMAKYAELMAKVHSSFPELKILIVSELVSPEIIKDIMPSINGYVIRTCSSEKVILSINEIFESGKYLCPKALDELFNCTRRVKEDSLLTIREREVLCSWIESNGNDEIANTLNISISTVRTHMNNIRQKLGNLNHLQLMIYACRQNILNQNFRPICPNCRSFCN